MKPTPLGMRLTTYQQLQQIVDAFAQGHLRLLILIGGHGLGKSQIVRKALAGQACWLEGNVSVFGLYCQLWKHRHRSVVLDDVDGLYAQRDGIRLLKCLTQSVVHKVDRLSRSLLDFAKLMEILDRHQVAFVSITQLFNTATSMGRLVLHILLSFAQFERELIAERTRDKIAAARRKGLWAGGMPLLGYDVDPKGSQLVVNAAEAERVRSIFALYREHRVLGRVVQELARRGWVQKCWRTRKGHSRGGQPFTTTSLRRLLSNVTYHGQIRYRDEVHPGEHPALVDATLWDQVQVLLRRSGATRRSSIRNPQGAFLHGILRCVPCGCAMTATSSTKGTRCYRYYVCSAAQKRGWNSCPAPAVSAGTIEQVVLEQLQRLEGFGSLWPRQAPGEQARFVQRLLERVDYDRLQGKLAITLQADHLAILAEAQARVAEETNP